MVVADSSNGVDVSATMKISESASGFVGLKSRVVRQYHRMCIKRRNLLTPAIYLATQDSNFENDLDALRGKVLTYSHISTCVQVERLGDTN